LIAVCVVTWTGSAMATNCELAADYYYRAQSESDPSAVIDWLKKSVRSCPNFNSWYMLGLTYAQQGEVEPAADAFSRARSLAVSPKTEALALARLGEQLAKSGQLLQASRAFELACRFHPAPVPDSLRTSLKQTRIRTHRSLVPASSIARVLGSGDQISTDGRFAVRPAVNLPVHFDFNRFDLTPAAARQVDELGLALSRIQRENRSFVLVGHTDKRGSVAYNQRLSVARALTVQQTLEQKFPTLIGRLRSIGRGETELLYDGDSQTDHQLNRRVKVKVYD
jgi:outer membrane protein OmpA-like peptidoglycan-associated protein